MNYLQATDHNRTVLRPLRMVRTEPASLTPETTREFARALNTAADRAEAQP